MHNHEPDSEAGYIRERQDAPSSTVANLQIGMASDLGCVRSHNEDSSLAWHLSLAQPGEPPASLAFLLVADGMGGQANGAEASALACRLAARHVLQRLCLPLLQDDDVYSREPINDVLETAVHIAHDAILHRLPGAGTTMTMALLLGDGAFVAHVGDSRAYLGTRGRLWPVTRDHSIAARLLEIGGATSEEVAAQRNVLYRAIGQGISAEPDILYRDLPPGTYVLLCCDGLWSKVADDEMAVIIDAAVGPDAACHELVTRAKERGGEDNISVVLAARGWPLPGSDNGHGGAGGNPR
jgi:serine/threonine protein phosphatase PrpC